MKYERAAAILLEAEYEGDEETAERHGVSIRSIKRWRRQMATDEDLAICFRSKKATLDAQWADELPRALRAGLACIASAETQAAQDPRALCNPAMIGAIAETLKTCAEIYWTGKIIDARLAQLGLMPNNEMAPFST